MVYLEPLGVGLVEFVAGDGAAGGHVGQHWSDVVWPCAIICGPPSKGDRISRIGITDEGSWTRVGTTGEGRVVGAFIGILRADLADDTGVGRPAWGVSLEILALDRDSAEGAVG